MRCMLFYDIETGKIKEALPSAKFLQGQDNMGVHVMGLKDRMLMGIDVPEDKLANIYNYRVNRDHSGGDGVGKLELISDSVKMPLYQKGSLSGLPWILVGHFLTATGYARFTRQFVNRMIKADMPFKMLDQSNPTFETCISDELELYRNRWVNPKAFKQEENLVYMGFHPPTMKYPRKKYNIVFTMLESYSIEPPFYKVMEASYDKFIVPTNFVKNVFSKYIDPDRVDIVPLGIDPSIYNPDIERNQYWKFKKLDIENGEILPTEEVPSNFRFLSVSRFSHRKGCDLVIKSFCHEFSHKDDVSLVLFFLPEDEKRVPKLHTDMINLFQKYSSGKKMPPVYIVDKPWPESKQSLPYSWGDCFVFPSRGEGFGLPPLEAAACGLPVIMTNCSGMSDFATDDVCFPIEPDYIDSIGRMSGKRFLYMGKYPEWRHDYFHPHTFNTQFPIMNTPEIYANIGEKMRYVYENHSSKEVTDRVSRMHDLILSKYTWDINFEKLYDMLRKVQ